MAHSLFVLASHSPRQMICFRSLPSSHADSRPQIKLSSSLSSYSGPTRAATIGAGARTAREVSGVVRRRCFAPAPTSPFSDSPWRTTKSTRGSGEEERREEITCTFLRTREREGAPFFHRRWLWTMSYLGLALEPYSDENRQAIMKQKRKKKTRKRMNKKKKWRNGKGEPSFDRQRRNRKKKKKNRRSAHGRGKRRRKGLFKKKKKSNERQRQVLTHAMHEFSYAASIVGP